jgi:hypothetical protein
LDAVVVYSDGTLEADSGRNFLNPQSSLTFRLTKEGARRIIMVRKSLSPLMRIADANDSENILRFPLIGINL